MWEHRREFVAGLTAIGEAMDLVEATPGLTVLSDAADATSSGASGDSTCLLRAILTRQWDQRCLLAVVDAPAARKAYGAGVGAEIDLRIGGTLDPGRHAALDAHVAVEGLFGGRFAYENGTREDGGPTAVVRSGCCTILITTRPVYVVGQAVYRYHGLEPGDFDVVVVKSPNGFRTYYRDIAERIVAVDCPGSTSANLQSLPYRRCRRPMFPLDEVGVFEPVVQYIEPGR